MSAPDDARQKLGWRYRRFIPTLVFLPLTVLFIVLAHALPALNRYVFELETESRRDVALLSSGQELFDVRAVVKTPLDEPAADCWTELSRGVLGRDVAGKVQLITLTDAGHPRPIASDARATAELKGTVSAYCWRETVDDRLVAPAFEGVYVLKHYTVGAWARGFGAFGALLFVFALGGAVAGGVVRRPAALEIAGAASVAVFVELLLLLRSIGWDPSVLGELLVVHDALGSESAALLGFAPVSFLLFMPFVAAAMTALVVALYDEVRAVRRCKACLGPSDVSLPRGAPCPLCGTADAPDRLQWLALSAAALAAGLTLTAMLHFGASLGVFEACGWTGRTDSCREAMQAAGEGVLDWSYFGRTPLFEGDVGRLVVFRPALYLALVAGLFAVFPILVGRFLRDGRRTTLTLLPVLWVTSLVVSVAVVPNGLPYFYFVLLRLHVFGVIPLGVVGLVGASLGLRLRSGSATGTIDDLTDDESERPLSIPPPVPSHNLGAQTPFRGRQPGVVVEEAPLSEDVVRALRRPFIVRYKWALVAFIALLGAGGGTFAFLRLRPTVEDRFASTPFGKALGDPLTRYCIGMGTERATAPKEHILSADVSKQIGSDTFDDLRATLDAAVAYEKARTAADDDAAAKALFAPINALDAKLAARGVLGHIAGRISGSGVWLLSYAVHRRDEIKVDAQSMRVVRGSRLDDLNYGDSVDFKAHDSDWVTVSMDRLEEELSGALLNAVVHGELAKDGELQPSDTSSKAALLRKVGALVGGELVASSRLSKDEATDVASSLHQRNDWIDELRGKGASLDSSALFLSRPVVKALSARKDDLTSEQVLRANDSLVGYKGDIGTAADLLADLEEEEFVVRLLEEQRLKDTSIEALKSIDLDASEFRAVASAELAKLGRPQKCPRLALWRTAEHAFGDDYSRAGHALGRLILVALYKELGVSMSADFDAQSFGDDDFDAALGAAMDKSPTDVAAAAARLPEALLRAAPRLRPHSDREVVTARALWARATPRPPRRRPLRRARCPPR